MELLKGYGLRPKNKKTITTVLGRPGIVTKVGEALWPTIQFGESIEPVVLGIPYSI